MLNFREIKRFFTLYNVVKINYTENHNCKLSVSLQIEQQGYLNYYSYLMLSRHGTCLKKSQCYLFKQIKYILFTYCFREKRSAGWKELNRSDLNSSEDEGYA